MVMNLPFAFFIVGLKESKMPRAKQACICCEKSTAIKKTRQWRTQVYLDFGRKRVDSRNHYRRFFGYVCRECSLKLLRMREAMPIEIRFP